MSIALDKPAGKPRGRRSLRRRAKELRRACLYWTRGEFRHKYLYISHHKCATQFTRRIILRVCKVMGLRWAEFDAREDRDRVTRSGWHLNNFMLLMDYNSQMLDVNSVQAKGFHVIRDPRDILVSTYFSHEKTHRVNHSEIGRDRDVLRSGDLASGLRFLLDESTYFGRFIETMENWNFDSPNIHEATYEDLTGNPVAEFTRIFDFLGIPIEPGQLGKILESNNFQSMKTRWASNHPETHGNHYRRGVAGDWVNHFDAELKDEFKRRHGNLLIKLGYERDLSW